MANEKGCHELSNPAVGSNCAFLILREGAGLRLRFPELLSIRSWGHPAYPPRAFWHEPDSHPFPCGASTTTRVSTSPALILSILCRSAMRSVPPGLEGLLDESTP